MRSGVILVNLMTANFFDLLGHDSAPRPSVDMLLEQNHSFHLPDLTRPTRTHNSAVKPRFLQASFREEST